MLLVGTAVGEQLDLVCAPVSCCVVLHTLQDPQKYGWDNYGYEDGYSRQSPYSKGAYGKYADRKVPRVREAHLAAVSPEASAAASAAAAAAVQQGECTGHWEDTVGA